jgi:hypothetical protein
MPVRHQRRQNMSKDAQLNALTAWSPHSMLDLSTHRKIMASTCSISQKVKCLDSIVCKKNTNEFPVSNSDHTGYQHEYGVFSAALEKQPPPFLKVRVRLPAGSCWGKTTISCQRENSTMRKVVVVDSFLWHATNQTICLSEVSGGSTFADWDRVWGFESTLSLIPNPNTYIVTSTKPLSSVQTVVRRLARGSKWSFSFT